MAAKNRKKNEAYRFNGYTHLDEKSIRSFDISHLKSIIAKYTAKLSDPHDVDDEKWTRRWLSRFEKELNKKQNGLASKQQEQAKVRRMRER